MIKLTRLYNYDVRGYHFNEHAFPTDMPEEERLALPRMHGITDAFLKECAEGEEEEGRETFVMEEVEGVALLFNYTTPLGVFTTDENLKEAVRNWRAKHGERGSQMLYIQYLAADAAI